MVVQGTADPGEAKSPRAHAPPQGLRMKCDLLLLCALRLLASLQHDDLHGDRRAEQHPC